MTSHFQNQSVNLFGMFGITDGIQYGVAMGVFMS